MNPLAFPVTQVLKENWLSYTGQDNLILGYPSYIKPQRARKFCPSIIKNRFMITCPRCQQEVDSQALQCPYCRNLLKAYGHPGMTLHQAIDGQSLCDRCVYNADDK
jgi:Double zinc ribbon